MAPKTQKGVRAKTTKDGCGVGCPFHTGDRSAGEKILAFSVKITWFDARVAVRTGLPFLYPFHIPTEQPVQSPCPFHTLIHENSHGNLHAHGSPVAWWFGGYFFHFFHDFHRLITMRSMFGAYKNSTQLREGVHLPSLSSLLVSHCTVKTQYLVVYEIGLHLSRISWHRMAATLPNQYHATSAIRPVCMLYRQHCVWIDVDSDGWRLHSHGNGESVSPHVRTRGSAETDTCTAIPSIRPSVCLSRSGIVSIRLNISSKLFHNSSIPPIWFTRILWRPLLPYVRSG